MLADFADHFSAGTGYLNTATLGLPPREATEALRRSLIEWENGQSDPVAFDASVNRSRTAYATIAGAQAELVAIVGQVSVASALVASSLPDGSRVLCAEEDFTSVLYPFLSDQRLQVEVVPLAQIIDRLNSGVDLVAVERGSVFGWNGDRSRRSRRLGGGLEHPHVCRHHAGCRLAHDRRESVRCHLVCGVQVAVLSPRKWFRHRRRTGRLAPAAVSRLVCGRRPVEVAVRPSDAPRARRP